MPPTNENTEEKIEQQEQTRLSDEELKEATGGTGHLTFEGWKLDGEGLDRESSAEIQEMELTAEQLENASGGNNRNQLWGDYFIVDPQAAAPDTGSLATKETETEPDKDKR